MIRLVRAVAPLLFAGTLACSGGDGPNEPPPAPALSVASAPAAALAATVMTPGIVVRVQPVSYRGIVTVAIDSGLGTLQGTTTATVARGEATFPDLRIAGVGRFMLRFSTPGAPDVRSGVITVSPDSGSRLAIRTAPSPNVISGSAFAVAPALEARSAVGVMLTYPVAMHVTLVRGIGTLTGTTTAVSSGGLATFSGLGATGFSGATLRFSAFGFTSVDANVTIQIYALYVRPRLPNDRDTLTVPRGTAVDVAVRLVTGPGDIVGSARFDVVWDPRVLTLVQDQPGPNTSVLVNRAQLAEGVLQVTLTAAGLSGTPDLMHLNFRAEQSGEGPISTRILDVRAPDGRDMYRSNISSTVRVVVP